MALAALQDMTWCQEYALSNRRLMLDLMIDCVAHELSNVDPDTDGLINIHHNYCASEPCNFQVGRLDLLSSFCADASSLPYA